MISALRAFPLRRVLAAIGVLATTAPSAWAGYRIGAGDTLAFSVAGLPELAVKAPVDIDGSATFPLVGPLPVAGLEPPQVLAKLQAVLPGKEYRHRTDDGREFPVIILPDEVGLTVSTYRPVYINGDVAKPGEEAFAPGLTVRKAVALAGGFDLLRFKLDNPFLQLSDLTSEYNLLWIDYTRQQALLARLRAELDGKPQVDDRAVMATPVAPTLAREILANENGQLAVRNADYGKEKAYLKAAVTKEADRAGILSEQQAKEQDGVKADQADLDRYTDLNSKGAVALPALSEARRTVLLSSTRALQTTALLDSVEREHQDLDRRLDRVDDSRRMQLLKDIQDATTTLAGTRAKLQAASEKLRYTGMVKSQLVRGMDSAPKVTLLRSVDGRDVPVDANVDTELQPGDTIEIALQSAEMIPPSQ